MLYKYLPPERIDVLENLKIRFSPLLSLNDPFERLPLIDMQVEKCKLYTELESGLEELWNNTDELEKTETNRAILEQTKLDLSQYINNETDSSSVGKSIIESFGDNFGVLSLSRTEKSLLMWSVSLR